MFTGSELPCLDLDSIIILLTDYVVSLSMNNVYSCTFKAVKYFHIDQKATGFFFI